MINTFIVEGFKALGKRKKIEFAPITVLIGNNGSGKSSLIKSILTYPKLFNIKTELTNVGMKLSIDRFHDFFGVYQRKLGILKVDPTDNLGNSISFQNIVNNFGNNGTFQIGTELTLKQLENNQLLVLTVKPDHDDYGELHKLEVIDKENNELFLEISRQSKEQTSSLILKLNLHKFHKNLIDYIEEKIQNHQKDKDNNLISEELNFEPNSFVESKENFIKNLKAPFHKQKKLIYSSIEFNEGSELSHFISNYKVFHNKQKYIFTYSFEFEENNDQFEKSSNIKKVKKAEKNALDLLSKGIEIKIGPKEKFISCENFFDSFLSNPEILVNILAEEVKKNLDDYTEILGNEESIKLSPYGSLFIKELVVNNLQHAILKSINNYSQIEYIPPYKFRNDSNRSNTGTYKTIIKRLREIKQKNVWFGASEYFTEYWLKHFDIGERIELEKLSNNANQIYLVKGGINLPIEDQGFGLSQLIPLIYMASLPNYLPESETELRTPESYFWLKEQIQSTFLIEEPESNLHPTNQSKLADLFIDAHWKFGHQFIVETHSEYFIRKLQYWVAKGILKQDKVKILYFTNDKSIKGKKDVKIREITIKADGDLSSEFDPGFFDESTTLIDMLRDLRKNHKN
jgi:predicted ATPase